MKHDYIYYHAVRPNSIENIKFKISSFTKPIEAHDKKIMALYLVKSPNQKLSGCELSVLNVTFV